MRRSPLTALSMILCLSVLPVIEAAWAQDAPRRGSVRVQGQELNVPEPEPETIAPQVTIDLREQMRDFVGSIGDFARQQQKGFEVATMGGRQLLTKIELGEEERRLPAMAYLISIDAVMQERVFFGDPEPGAKPEKEIQDATLQDLKVARDQGTPVFVIDHVKTAAQASESLIQAKRNGFVSFPAWAPKEQLNDLPPWPETPFDENSLSIRSLKDVKNFIIISRPEAMGRQDEFALKVHDTNYDLVIVNPFHGREPLTAQAVETLKYKKLGARRLVFARINIGEAAAYHYYWKPGWREGSPAFINGPVPGAADRYFVRYWDPAWRNLISGNNQSFVAGVMALGFDGVVLDGLDSVRFFEGGE